MVMSASSEGPPHAYICWPCSANGELPLIYHEKAGILFSTATLPNEGKLLYFSTGDTNLCKAGMSTSLSWRAVCIPLLTHISEGQTEDLTGKVLTQKVHHMSLK